MRKEKAIIYGIGKLYREIEESINEKYEVVAKADKNVNILEDIMPIEKALLLQYDQIVIAIANVKECFNIVNMLMKKYGVPYDRINLGLNLRQNNSWDALDIASKGIIFKANGMSILTQNIDEFNNIKDIFCANCYSYFLNDTSGEVVIDIGMNLGGASLFFASKENVVKVYGYEPFPETFSQARTNIELNGITGKERIECFPYGISDRNETRRIVYNKNMTCGQSTNIEANTEARKNYREWELICDDDDELSEVEVRDIKDVITKIYEAHERENIVLKLDCEGEEFRIMERLDEVSLFNRIKIIMLEWHYGEVKKLFEILKKNQYMYWEFRHDSGNGGLIYAFKTDK